MGRRQLTNLRYLLQVAPEGLQGSHLRLFPLLKLDFFIFPKENSSFWGNALKYLSQASLVTLHRASFSCLLPLHMPFPLLGVLFPGSLAS